MKGSSHRVRRIHRDFRLPVLLCRFSERRRLCWLALAISMIVARVALVPLLPVPEPRVHDEFSYLLAADTFAHGRLVNPAPAQPQFFESPHVLVSPIYASKYQPGQGLLLAAGQKFLGHPYWAVVLSCAVMLFLFCWATDAWLPPQWTLIAGGLGWILFFVQHYWFTSYWGGALAACGGALMVGGLGRILGGGERGARASLAAGAIIFYLTRPYEGAAVCIAVLCALGVHAARMGAADRGRLLRRVILPNAAIVASFVPLAIGYNVATTGKATELPYQMHARQYDAVPVLWILPPYPEKHYTTLVNRETWAWAKDSYDTIRSMSWPRVLVTQSSSIFVRAVGMQFLGFGLLLGGVPWARTRRPKKWLVLVLATGAAALLAEVWVQEHYSAPFTATQLILIVAAGRALWYRAAAVPWGAAAMLPALIVLLAPLVLSYADALRDRPTERGRVAAKLTAMGGRHLIFVDYDPRWDFFSEWVYNGADLDGSRLLFAHPRAPEENARLLEQFPGRTAWHVHLGPGTRDVRVEPYDAAGFSATVTTYSPNGNGRSK